MSDEIQLAGRGRRLAATTIDFIVVPLVGLLLMLVSGIMESAEAYAGNQTIIRAILLGEASYLLVNGWLLINRGQTLGKAILGIVIVGIDSNVKAPWWKLLFVRALFFPTLYLAVIPWLGIIAALDQVFIFGKQRRCLHDWICGTKVVRREA